MMSDLEENISFENDNVVGGHLDLIHIEKDIIIKETLKTEIEFYNTLYSDESPRIL
jgi:hypothetical protein